MINDINTIFAELEKPIMYGRLRKIRDEVGEKNFPLIQQYYYPDHKEIIFTPKIPYVLKVSYPHAGYGKIRVKENDDTIDLASIIALHNDYSAAEPLIDVDYELRIVFIAPNYYRVHKRQSMNWKVNFLMTNVREDCEMSINYKKWVDLIYKNYPDMEIFDIDALVDKNGKEYILEVNGSTQGFSPEHGDQDLEYMKNFVLRKLELICGIDILDEGNEMKLYFKKDKVVELSDEEKDVKIVNLKNEVSDLEKKCRGFEEKYENLKKEIMEEKKFNLCDILDNKKWIVVFISVVVLIIGIGLIKLYRK